MAIDVDCELCDSIGGHLVWQGERCRVVRVAGPVGIAFPGFCRVIWNEHVAEMSDLSADDARYFLAVVLATERAVKRVVRPDKINLASLGNMVPHLHWHVIPRWKDDSHFPASIWTVAQRSGPVRPLPAAAMLLAALQAELATLTETP
jgi:diadenosine tetraphosphate (Ap4A) HIT family hydrolase